ncbi:MAG: hypothetical protein IJA02_04875 [Clostridia bacterium]|nr:hypothetical protein [Clostridia bacterium]
MIKKITAIFLAAVMLLGFAACGEKTDGKITAKLSDVYEDGGLKEYYLSNKEAFVIAAQNDLAMDEAAANSFLSNPDSWQVYALDVEVLNKTDEAYTCIGFEAAGNMADGFYFSKTSIGAEFSIPYGEEPELYPATIVVNTEKVTVEQMYTVISGLDITIVGYPTPEDDDAEIPESDYKKIKVTNNIEAPEADAGKADDEISAKRSSVEDGSAFLEIYRKNDIAFSNEAKLYGMDSETAAQVLAKDGGWECYILYIIVENKTDDDMTVYSINAANNGANGLWVNSISQYGEFSMEPGSENEMPVTIMLNPAQLGGMTFEQALAAVEMTLTYSKGTLIDAQGNESVAIKKTAEVK